MSENEKPKENGSEDPKENGGEEPKENEGTEESQIASDPRPIPEPLKFRESLDFTITKTIILEGDVDSWPPRFGSSGSIQFNIINISGASHEQIISTETLSRYFVSSPCEFIIGSAETELDRQLERCIQMMQLNESSQFNMRVLLEPNLNGGIGKLKDVCEPDWISIELNITLDSLCNADPIYKWFNETKLNKALDFHSAGVRLFKEKRYLDSFHMFKTAYKLSVLARGLPTDNYGDTAKAQNLMNLCCNNLAACHFQWKNNQSVIDLSDKVLESDPDNVKTLYRKSVSNKALQEYEEAEKDLIKAKKLEPNNRAVSDELGRVQHLKKTTEAKLAQRMSKMFA